MGVPVDYRLSNEHSKRLDSLQFTEREHMVIRTDDGVTIALLVMDELGGIYVVLLLIPDMTLDGAPGSW